MQLSGGARNTVRMNARLREVRAEVVRLLGEEAHGVRLVHATSPKSDAKERADAIRAELALFEAEYADTIEQSIDAWIWGGPLSPLHPVPQAWRRVRLLAAHTLLGMLRDEHALDPMAEMIFPDSSLEGEVIMKWLLTDWWMRHGIELYALLFPPQFTRS